ncbi:nuclear transport factor 2 family protein [Lysobacter tyrosinilyticus]
MRRLPVILLYVTFALFAADIRAADAQGYFRIGTARLDVSHAIAVIEDASTSGDDGNTMLFFSAAPLDAAKVAAAFDPVDAVREQEPAGGYIKLCITPDGDDCGLFFSPEGFNSGGYGELKLNRRDAQRIAGRFVLAQPEDFMGQDYQFDLRFDAAVTPPSGTALPAGGGEPGRAYNAYLTALAKGDIAALRSMAGEEGVWRYPEDDPTAAKEALKSARDEQPVQAEIQRGRLQGEDAILWVRGVDRDDIHRAGRVLMHKSEGRWQFEEADLDSVEE